MPPPPRLLISPPGVCLQCGDRGWPETLIACFICCEYAVHRYCLPKAKIPPNPRDPVVWFCEDCRPADYVTPPLPHEIAPSTSDRCLKSLPLPKQVEKSGHCKEKMLMLLPQKLETSDNCSEKKPFTIADAVPDEYDTVWRRSKRSPRGKKKSDHWGVLVPWDKAMGEKKLALAPLPAAASQDSIWRVSLNIMNMCPGGAVVKGFHLFLCATACERVQQEVKALDPAWDICVELVPRRGVWPKSFGKLGPVSNDVGLFLLAGKEEDGEGLVKEMVRHDLAMRAAAWRTKKAELLVFTSAVLPADLWMIGERFYLWGVFKGRMKKQTLEPHHHTT